MSTQRMLRRLAGSLSVALCAFTMAAPQALAQAYPSKPIRVIIPYQAGGSGDNFTRKVAEFASKQLGQPMIMENRGGAGGGVGAEMVAKAPADGYTISMLAAGIMTINPYIYKKLPYDPEKGLAPLSVGVRMPLAVVVNGDTPFKTIQELIAYAKANPRKLSFGSAGTGSSQHLAGEVFQTAAGVELTHVPYKGGAGAMNDLLGGHLALQFVHLPSARAQLSNPKMRVLALTSAARHPLLPDVPTVAEAGVPGYEYTDWFGFMAPAGMPKDVSDKLVAALTAGMKANESMFQHEGMIVVASTPGQMANIVREESKKTAELIGAGKITPQ